VDRLYKPLGASIGESGGPPAGPVQARDLLAQVLLEKGFTILNNSDQIAEYTFDIPPLIHKLPA